MHIPTCGIYTSNDIYNINTAPASHCIAPWAFPAADEVGRRLSRASPGGTCWARMSKHDEIDAIKLSRTHAFWPATSKGAFLRLTACSFYDAIIVNAHNYPN